MYSNNIGPFGGSHYSLCFFIPFHPKLPPPYNRVHPQVASLADAWRGLGLTYVLLRGLKRTSATLKLVEGYSKKDAAYRLSHNAGQGSSPTSTTSGTRGEDHLSVNAVTEKSLKGFGLGLEGLMTTITGLSQKARSKSEVKEIFTVVKTADRVVEGVKVAKGVIQSFTSPVGDALHILGAGGNGVLLGFNTVKVVLKGVKISKGLITVTKWCRNKPIADIAVKANQSVGGKRFRAIVKGLKASEGAVNVVRITKEAGRTIGMLDKVDQVLSWSVLMKGFKFTKSAIRVLEPLGNLPLGVISALGKGILEIKGAVEGFSVVMKAVALSKELYLVLLKGIGFTKGAMAAFNRRSFQSEEEYSQRTEVSFKGLCCNQQPSIIWSLTEAESYYLINRWEFISHSYSTKEVGFFIRTMDSVLGDIEDISPLPLSFLLLACCFDSDPCLVIPNPSASSFVH